MDLILGQEVFSYYFNNVLNPSVGSTKSTIERIINNPKNKFLLTKRIIDQIESCLVNDEIIVNYFQTRMTVLLGSSIIDIPNYNPEQSTDYPEEFKYALSCYNGTLISCIFLDSKSFVKTQIPYSVLNEISKPNLSWIICELAGNPNGLSVRYFDFQSEEEIDNFFKDIFLLPQDIDEVFIFDRQCNLNHNRFDALRKRKPRVRYLTARGINQTDNLANKRALEQKFGTRSELFLCRRENIHERRIIINSLIIESDDDFYNILLERRTWKIDILCCKETAKKHLLKVSSSQKML